MSDRTDKNAWRGGGPASQQNVQPNAQVNERYQSLAGINRIVVGNKNNGDRERHIPVTHQFVVGF